MDLLALICCQVLCAGTCQSLLEEAVIFLERFALEIQSSLWALYLSISLAVIPVSMAIAQETGVVEVSPSNAASLKVGKIEFANGSIYLGGLKLGEMHGSGIFKYGNGDVYEGEFVDGQLHGEGMFIFDSGDRYEGTFILGQRSGWGVAAYADGSQYEGEFESNQIH